jgi:hypothetical protein
MNQLQKRLGDLRRRLRRVVAFRGFSWTVAVLLLAIATVGVVDWRFHLPDLVRALVLTGTLAGASFLSYRLLFHPLTAAADDLSLALRIEGRFPQLNDALASAVQFLEQPDENEQLGSPALRGAAIKRALSAARSHDFKAVVDTRGLPAAGLSLFAAGGLALFLSLAFPQLAPTAFLRLTDPFGAHQWPRETQLEILAGSRVGRGEAFEIQARVHGLIPERATVQYQLEGLGFLEQTYEITRADDAAEGAFVARLEPSRVQQDFRFQVRANDAISSWYDVSVRPPPELVAYSGRASPQISIRPPAYTDLPAQKLPDGATSLEAIAGTEISLVAAVNRPIARAWLSYPPDRAPTMAVARPLSPLALPPLAGALMLAASSKDTWNAIPAHLSPDGRVLLLQFIARLSGNFVLHFEDDTGLENTRLIDLRVIGDPSPVVELHRPSRRQDTLEALPDGELNVQVKAEDPIFAIRSAYLEYRLSRNATTSDAPAGRLLLYDHETLGTTLPELLRAMSMSTAPALGPWRLRPQRLEISRRWSLKDVGSKEGHTLILQACADDFDDVAAGKKPGRSEQVEIHIVGRVALDISLNEAQSRVQQELLRLQKLQQDAIERVIPAESQARLNNGRLQPKQVDALVQAEQLQQQLKTRMGLEDEGIRAEIARILQTLRDNHLPPSGIHDRMEAVDRELDRLSRDSLPQIESLFAGALKHAEEQKPNLTSAGVKAPLAEARKQQEEVQKTLAELLKLLEPWSNSREIKGEAKSIFQEQRRLKEQVADLKNQIPVGSARESLRESERADLEKAAELQNMLAERAAQLVEKLGRVARERQTNDPEAAQQLREAADRGERFNTAGKMQEAAKSILQNQLASAERQQEDTIKAMDEILEALEDRREEELDRLVKKLKEAEGKLLDLSAQQDRLHEKVRQAKANPSSVTRAAELARLAREEEELQNKARELVRELNRLRAEDAERALGRASAAMQRAGRRLDNNDEAEEERNEIRDRLDDARVGLQQARESAENELAREKLAKLSDQIKGIKVRQESLTADFKRIHREVLQQKQWTRGLLSSMGFLADAQKSLGEETKQLSKDRLEGARVFAHLLDRAGEAMKDASAQMDENRERALDRIKQTPDKEEPALDLPREGAGADEVEQWQTAAVRRLDQLLAALKPDDADRRAPRGAGDTKRREATGNGKPGSDVTFPALGEVKALHALQQELYERTRRFFVQHDKSAVLSEKEKAELRAIQREQQEVADLFHEVTKPSKSEGEGK